MANVALSTVLSDTKQGLSPYYEGDMRLWVTAISKSADFYTYTLNTALIGAGLYAYKRDSDGSIINATSDGVFYAYLGPATDQEATASEDVTFIVDGVTYTIECDGFQNGARMLITPYCPSFPTGQLTMDIGGQIVGNMNSVPSGYELGEMIGNDPNRKGFKFDTGFQVTDDWNTPRNTGTYLTTAYVFMRLGPEISAGINSND